VKALIVGLGSIGRRHLANLRRLAPAADITVLRHASASDADTIPHGADRVVHDLSDALAADPGFAIIASAAPFHVPAAAVLAAAGVHMLIEKPLADSLDGVDDLLEACARERVVLMVGYHLRFDQSLLRVRREINDGAIGRVVGIRAEVGQYLPDWRPSSDYREGVSARRDLGGGVVLELSHELDYVRWLCGEIESVQAVTGQLGGLEIDVEDVAEILLRFEDGAIGNVHLDMLQRSSTRSCKVIGTDGVLSWNGLDGQASIFTAQDGQWSELCAPTSDRRNDIYEAELAQFLRCVDSGADVPVDGATGRRVLEIALAVKEAAATGRLISTLGQGTP
jgi:predicted dehydrogenase